MDEARYRFRKHLDVDYVAEVRVSHRLNPERRHTVDELRRWTTMLETPPFFFRRYVVEDLSSGVAVGFGGVYTDLDVQDPSRLWVDVVVDLDHQGRGIGRALAEKAEEEAWGAKAVAVLAQARSDRPRDMEFVTRRGYEERRRNWQSRLDLPAPGYANFPRRAEELARDGVEFTTLAGEGHERIDVRQRVHRLLNAALEDEPRLGPFTPSTYEQFVQWNLEGPGFLPEAFFLARKEGRYVGMSNLELLPAEPSVLHQVFTGTLREFRGRGIASELKRRTVEYGQEHGFRAIRTSNDSLNHPMWAINQKLGYRRKVPRVVSEKIWEPPSTH